MPDRVKPSFVTFDTGCFISCTHKATVGVKGFNVWLVGVIATTTTVVTITDFLSSYMPQDIQNIPIDEIFERYATIGR